MKIAVVGYGYWGPNMARNFSHNDFFDLNYICDIDEARLKIARQRYPDIKLTTDYDEIIKDDTIEAVSISTPVDSHFQLAYKALEAGKHIHLEKPMASSKAECEKLVEIADKKGVVLLIDHTFLYTGSVRKIKEIIESGELGEIYYFDSVRINLGLFQHDINVLWDLAPHDISIMNYLLDREPISVTALGASHIGNGIENLAYLHVDYGDELIGHLHANWLAPVKLRTTLIGASKKMIVYDDTRPSEKVRVYDKGIEIVNGDIESIYKTLVQYRTGDVYIPKIDNSEALELEVEHFAECIKDGTQPLTSGEDGLAVVEILEASQESIKNNGKRIKL